MKLVKLYFGEQRDWGRGVCKITLIGGISEKVLHSPDFKMVLTFLVMKLFQKGTMFNY